MAWNTFPLVLEWVTNVTPTTRHLAFRRADTEPFEFTAGQFINLHWDREGKKAHRSYSIANPPGQSELIEISVAPVEGGFATERLFSLEPGDMVEGSGPYGRFVLRDDPPCRYLLLATGTGVTPYRSMLPRLRELLAGGDYRIDLLLGVREPEELLFGERSKLLIDSSEERLKTEFEGVKRTYIPLHSVLRVDEVEKAGRGRITSTDGKVTSFPMPYPPQPKPPRTDD